MGEARRRRLVGKSPQCILCDALIDATNDSLEHVLPQAIGGRLKVRGLVCKGCNGWTGRWWDATLCGHLNWFSLTLGVERERGTPPPMPIETMAGEALTLHFDGVLTPRKPTVDIQPTGPSSASLSIVARSPKEATQILRDIARKNGSLDVDAALQSAVHEYRCPDSLLKASFDFGGPRGGRSIVKTALTFAASKGVDTRNCCQARAYLRSTEYGNEAAPPDHPFAARGPSGESALDVGAEPPFDYFYERDVLLLRPARVLHGVAVSNRGTDGQLLAYVEYFGARRCVVLLEDRYPGPDIHESHFIDPAVGEVVPVEFDLAMDRAFVAALFRGEKAPAESMVAAFTAPMQRAIERSHHLERERVFERAWVGALAALNLKPGDPISDVQRWELSRAIAERVTPHLFAQARRHAKPTPLGCEPE